MLAHCLWRKHETYVQSRWMPDTSQETQRRPERASEGEELFYERSRVVLYFLRARSASRNHALDHHSIRQDAAFSCSFAPLREQSHLTDGTALFALTYRRSEPN